MRGQAIDPGAEIHCSAAASRACQAAMDKAASVVHPVLHRRKAAIASGEKVYFNTVAPPHPREVRFDSRPFAASGLARRRRRRRLDPIQFPPPPASDERATAPQGRSGCRMNLPGAPVPAAIHARLQAVYPFALAAFRTRFARGAPQRFIQHSARKSQSLSGKVERKIPALTRIKYGAPDRRPTIENGWNALPEKRERFRGKKLTANLAAGKTIAFPDDNAQATPGGFRRRERPGGSSTDNPEIHQLAVQSEFFHRIAPCRKKGSAMTSLEDAPHPATSAASSWRVYACRTLAAPSWRVIGLRTANGA